MIMAVVWAKEHELVSADVIWYKERWERGTVIEKIERNWYGILSST